MRAAGLRFALSIVMLVSVVVPAQAAANRIPSPDMDVNSNGWVQLAKQVGQPTGTLGDNVADANDCPTSNSLSLASAQNAAFFFVGEAGVCVTAAPGDQLVGRLRLRRLGGDQQISAALVVDFYNAAGCGGTLIGPGTPSNLAITNNNWQSLEGIPTAIAPVGTQSAYFVLTAGSSGSWVLLIDRAYAGVTTSRYEENFEGGLTATCRWSSAQL